MTLYLVKPSVTEKNTWVVSVDGSLQDRHFSSFELASAYIYWLAMNQLLKIWFEDSGELYEKLKADTENLRADWLATATENFKLKKTELTALSARLSELQQELELPFFSHCIQLVFDDNAVEPSPTLDSTPEIV